MEDNRHNCREHCSWCHPAAPLRRGAQEESFGAKAERHFRKNVADVLEAKEKFPPLFFRPVIYEGVLMRMEKTYPAHSEAVKYVPEGSERQRLHAGLAKVREEVQDFIKEQEGGWHPSTSRLERALALLDELTKEEK